MMYLPLYQDAAKAFGQPGAIYSPTLTVASAGYWAEEYWQSRGALWRDPKLRRFMPWERLVRSINSATSKSSAVMPPALWVDSATLTLGQVIRMSAW